jgi:flagellar motor switch protein FliM
MMSEPLMQARLLPMDDALLARMTAKLGDPKTLAQITSTIGEAMSAGLAAGFTKATHVAIDVELGSVDGGLHRDMMAPLQGGVILATALVDGWSDDIRVAADAGFVIALTERFLGGAGQRPDELRPLSEIEIDVADILFAEACKSLAAVIGRPGDAVRVARAANPPFAEDVSEGLLPAYSGVITLEIGLPEAIGDLHLVVPQDVLLKTRIKPPVTEKKSAITQPQPAWMEQLTQQVHTSSVELQADIMLAPVSIDTASRLQPGDVIPFADGEAVRVLLSANGKDLFWCDFGKSGARYMLKLREQYGSEEDLLKQLTA